MRRWLSRLAAVAVGLGACAAVIALLGAAPEQALELILAGAFGTAARFAYVLTAWAPLALSAAGLLLTFRAGLWNIGVEGQIVMGAVAATGALISFGQAAPAPVALMLAAAAGMLGGTAWAWVAGSLRYYGGVNEIFGGLGLNFIAGSYTVHLVLGPWKRPGIGSTSGTAPFPPDLWLPAWPGFPVSPIEIGLALAALGIVAWLLKGTRFGLELKAAGLNPRAAFILGVPTERRMLAAFALCGALAGLAGWLLVVGASARHNLFPLISSGYGFIAIMAVLLAGLSARASALVALVFAAILMGSLQLAISCRLDSSLGGVIQGVMVLAVILARGVEQRWTKMSQP